MRNLIDIISGKYITNTKPYPFLSQFVKEVNLGANAADQAQPYVTPAWNDSKSSAADPIDSYSKLSNSAPGTTDQSETKPSSLPLIGAPQYDGSPDQKVVHPDGQST